MDEHLGTPFHKIGTPFYLVFTWLGKMTFPKKTRWLYAKMLTVFIAAVMVQMIFIFFSLRIYSLKLVHNECVPLL